MSYQQSITTIFWSCSLLFSLSLGSCGSTQQLSQKVLEDRITALEAENKVLKRSITILQGQVEEMTNYLPKPGQAGQQSGVPPAQGFPKIEAAKTIHDFGTIPSSTAVAATFHFKNVGTAPLEISKVKAACGCTMVNWPKEPIPVGGKGHIDVRFSPQGKQGAQHKSITIVANTNPITTNLYIKALVQD